MSNEAPIDGYVDPSIPNPNGEQDAPIIIYGYTPHPALSALALTLYAVLLLLHTSRLYLHRLYPFSTLLLLTTICELVGYAFRLRSSPPPLGDPYNVLNFVIQYFFIVVAPVFLSAAIYTTLTSLIAYTSLPPPLNLSRKLILAVFIVADIIATVIQVAGAALIGSAESDRRSPTTANNILLAGLSFQVFSFALFLLLLSIFIRNARKALEGRLLRRVVGAVVGSSALVYLRTCFRLAETAQGVGGYASAHEGFFGGLEFAPVVGAVAVLGWWHPGRVVGRGRG
ncbi:MAG: hypothetical protein Q9195_008999 [Heterodermia aff. obscurata]